MFEVIPKDLTGFPNILVANFLPVLAEIIPKILKELPRTSVGIVLSEKVIGFLHYKMDNNQLVLC